MPQHERGVYATFDAAEPAPEPVYVRAMRARLRHEIESRRQVERENFRLRTELKRLTEKLCRHLSGKKR
jgi:hypothetical protein